MHKAFMYGQDADGVWRPYRTGATGLAVGGPGGSAVPTGQETTQLWSYAAASGGITDTADVALSAAPGVGKSNYLTGLQLANTSVTATEVVVKDGSTVIWRTKVGASMTAPVNITFERPLVGSNNTALNAACITNATVTYINAQGYIGATIANINAQNTPGIEIFDEAGNQVFDANGAAVYMA